jgi:threonine dehydrogenase-like Zn-dependent dehydrogenase
VAPTPKFQKGIIDFPFGTLWLKQLSLKSGPVSIRDLVPTLKALIESGRAQPSFVFEREISIEQAHDAYEEFSNHEFVKAHIAFPEHC